MSFKNILNKLTAILVIVSMLMSSGFMMTFAATSELEITTDKFGNIFYRDDLVQFNLTGITGSGYTVLYTVEDFRGAEVYKKADNGVVLSNTYTTVLDEFDIFGVFHITAKVYGANNNFIAEDTVAFSRINNPNDGVYNKDVGIHVLFQGDGTVHQKSRTEIVDAFRKAGFGSRRTELNWQGYEVSKGSWSFPDNMANELSLYQQDGRWVMLLLSGGNNLYTNATDMPSTDVDNDGVDDNDFSQYEAWQRYCERAATDAGKYGVDTFEIWNEPDASNKHEYQKYARLIKYAYAGITKVIPNAKLLVMTTSWCAPYYVNGVMDAGIAEYGDAFKNYFYGISIHPYSWNESAAEKDMFSQIQGVRDSMTNYGIGSKPIWATEFGWSNRCGVDEQAENITQFLVMNDVYKAVEQMYIFRYVRHNSTGYANEEFGFLDNYKGDVPHSAFPQYGAVANFNAIMPDAVYEKTIPESGTYLYQFALNSKSLAYPNGTKAVAMFATEDEKYINLNLGCTTATLYDMYGNSRQLASSTGIYDIKVDKEVSYIVGNFTNAAVATGSNAKISSSKLGVYEAATVSGGTVVEKSDNVIVFENGAKFLVTDFNSVPWVRVNSANGSKIYYIAQKEAADGILYQLGRDGGVNFNSQIGAYHQGYDEEHNDAILFNRPNSEETGINIINKNSLGLSWSGTYVVGCDILVENPDMYIDIIQQKDNSTWNYLFGLRNNEVYTGSGTTLYSTSVAFDKLNKWHRFEAVITLGWRNGSATYYFDGVQVGTGTTKNALNHVMIQTPAGSGKGTFYVDNLVVKEPGKLAAKVSVSPVNIGDSFEIEFSDSVESFALADVSLVNTETNKSVELKSAEKVSATTYRVSVNEKLENNGEYGVVISKNVKSAVSGAYCGDVLRLNAGGTRVGGFVKGVTVIGSDGKAVNDTTVAPTGSTMVVSFSDDTASDAANSIFVNGENANGVWNDSTKEYVLTVPEYQNNAMELSVTDKYMDRAYKRSFVQTSTGHYYGSGQATAEQSVNVRFAQPITSLSAEDICFVSEITGAEFGALRVSAADNYNYSIKFDSMPEGLSGKVRMSVSGCTDDIVFRLAEPVTYETLAARSENFDQYTLAANYSYSDRAINTFPATEYWKRIGNASYALGAFVRKDGTNQDIQIDGYFAAEGSVSTNGVEFTMPALGNDTAKATVEFGLAHKKLLIAEAPADNYFQLKAISNSGTAVNLLRLDGTKILYFAGENATTPTEAVSATNAANSLTNYKRYKLDMNFEDGKITFYADDVVLGSGNFAALLQSGVDRLQFSHLVTTYDNNDGEMNAYNMALENYEPYKDPRAEGCSSRFDNLVVSKTVPVSRLEEKPVVSETFSFDLPTYSYSDRALNTFPETENWKTYGNRAYALGAFISKEGGSQNLQIDGYVGQEGVSYDTGAALLMNDRNAQAVEMALTFELAHKKKLITEATGDNFFILRAVSKKGAIVPLMKVDGTTISYYAGETAQNATAVSNVTNSDNSITRYKPYRIDFNKANGMVTFYADGMQIGSGNFTSLLNDGISEIRFGHIVTVYDNNDGKISSLNMASENLPPYSNPRAEGCTSRVDNIVVTQMTPAEMLDVETVSLGYANEKRNTANGYISPLCDTVSVKFNKAVDVSSLGGITVKDAVGTVLGTDNRAYDEESFTYSFRIKDVLQQNAEYYVYIPSTVLEANGMVSLGKNISCKINTAYGYNKIEQPYMTELDENTVEFGVKIYNYEQGEDVYTFAKATYGTENSFDLEADEIDLTTTPGKAVWYTVDKTKLDRGTKIKTFLFESAANIKPVYECNEYLIQ